ISQQESVLLDRLQSLVYLETYRRHCFDATDHGRPPLPTRPKRTGQNCNYRVCPKINRSRAEDAFLADAVQIAADKEWNTIAHGRCRLQQPIVLLSPSLRPIRFSLRNSEFTARLQQIGVPFSP